MSNATMPAGLVLVRTTPEFSAQTVPAALQAAHQIGAGLWGRLRVLKGGLRFVFERDPPITQAIGAGEHIDIPPLTPHRVELQPDCRFVVEFYK